MHTPWDIEAALTAGFDPHLLPNTVGMDDQMMAAARDSNAVLKQMAGSLGRPIEEIAGQAKSRRAVAMVMAALTQTPPGFCEHVHPFSPEPVIFSPITRLAVCRARCAKKGLGSQQQHDAYAAGTKCDACAAIVPDRKFTPMVLTVGPMTAMISLCRTCIKWIDDGQNPNQGGHEHGRK